MTAIPHPYEGMANTDATPPHGDYYVTVQHAGRTGYMLGPYSDLRDADANMSRAQALAKQVDAYSHFYVWGVARLALGTRCKTRFA